MGVRLSHQITNPFRIYRLVGVERAGGAAPQAAQGVGQLIADDALAEQLVSEVVVDEKVVVEEVAERAVPDVMQQAGHPQQLLDQRGGGGVGEDRAQRRIELLGEAASQVHG